MIRPAIGALVAFFAMMMAATPTRPAGAQTCTTQTFSAQSAIVCDLAPGDLRLFWSDPEGKPFRRFSTLAAALADTGQTLALAINAGMYGTDFAPTGLYVEQGEQLRPLNTATVDGRPAQIPNFYKKPNGVFFIDDAGAHILPTDTYAAAGRTPRLATQSGPMLVIDGALHPALIENSTDRTRRSGVGVCENGTVRIAISQGDTNFFDFATLFRDHLSCPNALFLDGGQGAGLYHPATNRNDFSWHGGYGPMLGVVE